MTSLCFKNDFLMNRCEEGMDLTSCDVIAAQSAGRPDFVECPVVLSEKTSGVEPERGPRGRPGSLCLLLALLLI